MDFSISYSIAVFTVVLLAASVLNLLKQHYIFQITGIAFLFLTAIIKTTSMIKSGEVVSLSQLYFMLLPILSASPDGRNRRELGTLVYYE